MKALDKSLLAVLTLFIIFSACGGNEDSASCASGESIVSISVSPSNVTLGGNQSTQQFTAIAKDFNGQTVCGVSFAWTDTENISCIDQKGLVTIKKNPSGPSDIITASYKNIPSSPATINYSGSPSSAGC